MQESLHAATRMGAAKPDFTRVIVDTTVQPKAIAFPTDAKLLHRARELLVTAGTQTRRRDPPVLARLGKIALIRHQRYAHASSSSAPTECCGTLRTRLGRVIRGIVRRSPAMPNCARSSPGFSLAARWITEAASARTEDSTAFTHRKWRVIGKGKAHRPYEFGVKVWWRPR